MSNLADTLPLVVVFAFFAWVAWEKSVSRKSEEFQSNFKSFCIVATIFLVVLPAVGFVNNVTWLLTVGVVIIMVLVCAFLTMMDESWLLKFFTIGQPATTTSASLGKGKSGAKEENAAALNDLLHPEPLNRAAAAGNGATTQRGDSKRSTASSASTGSTASTAFRSNSRVDSTGRRSTQAQTPRAHAVQKMTTEKLVAYITYALFAAAVPISTGMLCYDLFGWQAGITGSGLAAILIVVILTVAVNVKHNAVA